MYSSDDLISSQAGGSSNFGTHLYAFGGSRGPAYNVGGDGGNTSILQYHGFGLFGGSVWVGGGGGPPGSMGVGSIFGGGGGGGGQYRGGPACSNFISPSPSCATNASGGLGRLLGKNTTQGPYSNPPPAPSPTGGTLQIGIGGGGPVGTAGNSFNGGGGGRVSPNLPAGAGGIAGGGGGAPGENGSTGFSGAAGGSGYIVVYSW
ncbi:hypothetical protein EB118_25700 [bacterium]|nr:hypothetical protein [bacterium]